MARARVSIASQPFLVPLHLHVSGPPQLLLLTSSPHSIDIDPSARHLLALHHCTVPQELPSPQLPLPQPRLPHNIVSLSSNKLHISLPLILPRSFIFDPKTSHILDSLLPLFGPPAPLYKLSTYGCCASTIIPTFGHRYCLISISRISAYSACRFSTFSPCYISYPPS